MSKKELNVEETLRTLFQLQLIDCKIDELQNIRGELPLEVSDMEDEIAGLESRLQKFHKDIEHLEAETSSKKNIIEESKNLIKKYTEQQNNVRNSREFSSISKEIEYQDLEIQLAQKRIKEYKAQIEFKKQSVSDLKKKIEQKKTIWEGKKNELDSILASTEKEETLLTEKSKEISENLEPRILNAYQRIQKNMANRMAVVPVERGAAGGSFFVIPPQVQMEIASRQKIITDEHSGRILVDSALAQEEREKMQDFFDSL